MKKNIKGKVSKVFLFLNVFIMVNAYKVYAITVPGDEEVDELSTLGIKLLFGFLAGLAVIGGGMEIYEALRAHRENKALGGYGVSNNATKEHVMAGIRDFLAAGVIYMVMRWILNSFGLG